MSQNIVFVDTVSRRAYSEKTLRETGLGGTEATTIRIAEELDALVLQERRERPEGRYRPVSESVKPTHIVTLREPKVALELSRRYPKAKHYLWLHDLHLRGTRRSKELAGCWSGLKEGNVTIIAVSNFHLKQIRSVVKDQEDTSLLRRIYNPIAPSPESVDGFDKNKLVYFSSPHKGLSSAVTAFRWLRHRNQDLQLFVANPGYWYWEDLVTDQSSGIVDMGALPHNEVLLQVRTALCTFSPNYVYPETFGLVFAESNAVGTPVLTHDIGAAREVIDDAEQVLPLPRFAGSMFKLERGYLPWKPRLHLIANRLTCYRAYEEKIQAWQMGRRPVVQADPRFHIQNVCREWIDMMAEE